jgi:hypothetical protein
LDLIALGRISCLHQVYDNLFSRKRFWKIFCLFVCLCLSGVWQLKHLHLQLTELNATSGCLLAPPRREGTKREYPRQYQTPFAPHLFTNISPTLYIFCLISFLFRGGTVLFFFWFQASSCRRIYGGIIGWAYKSMLMILPPPSFIGN